MARLGYIGNDSKIFHINENPDNSVLRKKKKEEEPALVKVAETVKPTTQTFNSESSKTQTFTQPTAKAKESKKESKKEKTSLKDALNNYKETIKNSAVDNQGFNLSNAITDIANLRDANRELLESVPIIGNYYRAQNQGRKSATNLATNMATGAVGTMEKAADAASDLVFNPIEQRYNYAFDYLTKGKKTADENLADLKKMQERDIKKNRTEKFLEDTGYNDIADELEEGSAIKRSNLGGQVSQGLGGMVPALVLGQAWGGAPELTNISGLQGKEKVAAALGNVGRTYMSQLPSNVMLGASSYGGGMEEALNDGASINRARAYGLTNAGIEQLTEMLTGGVPGLEGKGGIDQLVDPLINRNTNGYLNALLRAGYGALGEGLEESTGTYLDALARRGILGQNIDWNEVNKEALQSGLAGAATGAILNAPSTSQDFQNVRAENQIRDVLGDAEYAEGRGQYNPDYKGWENQREENRIEKEKKAEERQQRNEEFARIQQEREEEARKAQELAQEREKEQERLRQQEETNRALEAIIQPQIVSQTDGRKTQDIKEFKDIRNDYNQYYKKADMENFDNTVLKKAMDTIEGSKRYGRTKQQWLDVANNIGMQLRGQDIDTIKKYAFESFKDQAPNRNFNKQGKGTDMWGAHDWVRAVYEGARVNDTQQSTQTEVQETTPKYVDSFKGETWKESNNKNVQKNEVTDMDLQFDTDKPGVFIGRQAELARTQTLEQYKNWVDGLTQEAQQNIKDYGGAEKIWNESQTMTPLEIANKIYDEDNTKLNKETTQKENRMDDKTFEKTVKDTILRTTERDALDMNETKESFMRHNYNKATSDELGITQKQIEDIYDKYRNEDGSFKTENGKKLENLQREIEQEEKLVEQGKSDDGYHLAELQKEYEELLNQNIQQSNVAEEIKEPVIKAEEKPKKVETNTEEVEDDNDILNKDKVASKILNEVPKGQRPKLTEKIKKNIYKLRQKITDHQAAIYDMSREFKNPTLLHKADAIMSADNLAQNMLEKRQTDLKGKAYNNFTDEQGNKVSMGFEKAYDLYKKIPNEAKSEFLVHMRNIDQLNNGVDQFNIPLKESQERVAELRKEYKKLDAWADNIWTYGHNQLRNMVDSGFTSEALASKFLENNPHYVRIQRNVPNNTAALQNEKGNVKINSPIQKVKGSSLDIMPIKETQAQFTKDVMKAIKLNEFGQELAKTIGVSSDGGEITSLDEMFGVNQKVLNDEDGNYTFTIFDKGRPVTIPISEGIYDSLKTRKISEVPILSDITKFQREVLTNKNPYFAMTNAVKDFGDMMLYSKFPMYKSFGTYMELFGGRTLGRTANFVKNKANQSNNQTKTMKWVELYENRGNLSNTIFSDGEFRKQPGKVGKVVGAPLRGIEAANNFIESMPRITEFVNTVRSNGYDINSNGEVVSKRDLFIEENKNKLSKEELEKRANKIKEPTKDLDKVLAEADYNSAEVTTNFKRGGELAKTIDKNGGTFFSASVQGASKIGRTFTEAFGDAKSGDFRAAKRLFSRAVALGILPALINKIAYDDDKDYEELPDYVKDQYYLFKVKGTNDFVRIPKGRAVSLFESGAKRTMDSAQGKKNAWEGYGSLVENQIAPNNPLDSNILAPWSAVKNNRSWSGNQIVSDYLEENYNPDQQYDAKTSEFSKWVGKNIKDVPLEKVPLVGAYLEKIKSPKKLDYLIDQYSGVIGDIALPSMTNYAESEGDSGFDALANPFKSKLSTNSTLNNRTMTDYYKLKSKSIKDSNDEGATNLQKAKKEYIGDRSDASNHLSELYAEQREIQNDTSLSNSEKYAQNKAKQREIVDYMKQVMKDMENAKEKDGVVTIGDKSYIPGKNSYGQDKMKATSTEKLDAIKQTGLSVEDYSKVDSYISGLSADKDENGKSINGTKKKKAIAYLRKSGYSDQKIKSIVESYGWKFKEGD